MFAALWLTLIDFVMVVVSIVACAHG